MRILVTGANGFIGKSLCKTLAKYYTNVSGAVRFIHSSHRVKNINYISVGDIGSNPNWKKALNNCDCVIHCAGKAHVVNEPKKNSLESYRLINLYSTKRLAEQCVSAGVKRLIFLSSIGVLGLNTNHRKPFLFSDDPNPMDNYAISKFEAEKELFKISQRTGLETVVIRSPLVYGPAAPGNLARLIKIISYGAPLPFGKLNNKRSIIGIDNLVDLIIKCIDHPDAPGKTFLVSDDEDLSTTMLVKLIASSMGQKITLFSVPLFFLKILGFIIGKHKDIDKITSSLRVDISFTKRKLSWVPPISVKEGIKKIFQKQ